MMNDDGRVLSRISIKNFKSIRRAELDLGRLTVLVGENSAGKSTVLQLIFLLAQIATDRSRPEVVSLNGTELALGNFDDVLHSGSPGESIEIGLAADISVGSSRRAHWQPDVERAAASRRGTDTHAATWAIRLDDPPKQLGVAQISEIEIVDTETGERLRVVANSEADEIERIFEYSRSIGAVRGRVPTRARLLDARSTPSRFSGRVEVAGRRAQVPEEILPAVAVENGFPVELYVYTSEFAVLARRWLDLAAMVSSRGRDRDYMFQLRRQRRLSDLEGPSAAEVAADLFPALTRWIDRIDTSGHLPGPSEIDPMDQSILESVVGATEDVSRALVDLLMSYREEKPAIEELRPSSALEISATLKALLGTSVHYLGPLREDPKMSYRPGQRGDVATLGVKGEYWVAALDMFGSQVISSPLPAGGVNELSLLDAVNRWAEAFGLAREVRTEDKGRLGLEPQLIDPQTGDVRDPTSVGVGVSQLLPVIVICLLAQPGEVVLLEQPELHLHPAPQQILGDFLLGLVETGRQIIVETHSEYLVNRLRLRIAEDEYGSVADDVRLLYARREKGETRFTPMRPNKYGTFEDWPDGFFDQAPREAEEILRAAARKRRSKESLPSQSVEHRGSIRIHADYQGQRVEAEFDTVATEIKLLWPPLRGRTFSPSGAAIAVVKHLNPEVSPNRNGWRFWVVSDTGAPLDSLRQH